MDVGAKLKFLRERANLSVEELADKIGKSRATVYRYENGGIEKLPSSVLVPLALALNTTPADILDIESTSCNSFHFSYADKIAILDKLYPPLPKEETFLVYNFRRLNESGQKKVLDYVLDLLENDKYKSDEVAKNDERIS